MTSVQNPLQPLSGNKFLWLIILLLMVSCHPAKQITHTEVVGPDPNLNHNQNNENQNEQNNNNNEPENFLVKKNEYTIALLLPFHAGRVYVEDLNGGDYFFPDETQVAVEYYQGALLALDSLSKIGLRTRLLVYDVELDSFSVKEALRKPEVKNADLIIGPMNMNGLKVVNDFSCANKIYCASPFSATAVFSKPNPYYVLCNATMRTHCERMYDFIRKKYFPKEVLFLYKQRPDEKENMKYFTDYQKTKAVNGSNDLQFISLTDSTAKKYSEIKSLLSAVQANVIVIPSNDEIFVRNELKQLDDLSSQFNIIVFGMPTWSNFKSIGDDVMEHLHVHITSNYFLDKNQWLVQHFKDQYSSKYDINPTVNAVRGYDQMLFFGNMLMNTGVKLNHFFSSSQKNFLADKFNMTPVEIAASDSTQINYYENTSVYQLKFEFGAWSRETE